MACMSGNDECPSGNLAKIQNRPIGFWIMEQRAT